MSVLILRYLIYKRNKTIKLNLKKKTCFIYGQFPFFLSDFTVYLDD